MKTTSSLKILYAALTLLFLVRIGFSQSPPSIPLTIDSCYAWAEANYPLIKQMELVERTRDYTLANANKGNLPQLVVNGQATYQSDVTRVPGSGIPGVNITPLSKDQYKLYGEVTQPLSDMATIKQQKELVKANAVVEKQKIAVELNKLKERVNQLFFGTLLIDAQIAQALLLKKDIQTTLGKTQASITNGVALKSAADQLQAELLKADQRVIELKANRGAFINMLVWMINTPLTDSTQLAAPLVQSLDDTINRPEVKLYTYQKLTYDVQNRLISTRNIPRLNLFFQGGYGRPALNFLSNDFTFYYLGGLRLSWNIAGFYTTKKDHELLSIGQQTQDILQETFLFDTKLTMTQQNSEVSKYKSLLLTDQQIVDLRESVKTSASAQLDNGAITTNDYLTYVNAEDQARQNLLVHQVQLLLAQYTYKTTTGN